MNDILLTPIRLHELETLIQNSVSKGLKDAQLYNKANQPEPDQLLNVQETADFLGVAVPTIYGYVQRAEIPVCKRSKRLYFSKQELFDWVKEGRKLTVQEIEEKADQHLSKKKKGGKL